MGQTKIVIGLIATLLLGVGIALFGDKKKINRLTGMLPLLRG